MEEIEKGIGSDIEFPIFAKWYDFVKWTLPVTEKLPKRVRFTLTNRIQNLSLDVIEDLVDARYSKEKDSVLKKIDLKLEKLRILFRLSFEEKLIAQKTYYYAVKNINEVGKMLGGWIRSRGSTR